MKIKLLIVLLMLVLSVVLIINAQPGLVSKHSQQGRNLLRNPNFIPLRLLLQVKDKIGLSAEQEKKLTAINEAHEQWLIKYRADMEIKALKLQTTLAAEKLNVKEAEQLIREQANMHAEMQIARLRFQLDVKAMLTAEQLAKISELKKDFHGLGRKEERQRGHRK